MELNLEVVLSTSIKRKKPWPRFCWLGQEKESVFLLDDKRVSEINMVSGRTKKRMPKLHPLLNNVVTMASSYCGTWLCGVLLSGELFLWNRDRDLLKTVAAVPEVVQIISAVQGNSRQLSVQVSGDGMRVLLVTITGQVFLWECVDVRDLTGVRDGTVKGCWAHIKPQEDTALPSPHNKEASQHTVFVKSEAVGDICLSTLVFTSGKKLIITCLKIQWEERHMRVSSVGYSIQWTTKTYLMSHLNPPCQSVKSRGALVPAFSPDGLLLAIVINQRQPKATQILYVSTQNFVSVSSGLGGCGIKAVGVPSKYIRSYWVGSVSWSPNSLFLACVLKRGSLLMLARLGNFLTLTTSGCNVDFGPAQFLPLHPLVTYRPPVSAGNPDASLSSSSLSMRDVLRQRYSVTWHPRLLYLIVSDGYMATVMRVLDQPSPALLLKMLLKDTVTDLEKMSHMLSQSQSHVREWLESVSYLNPDSNESMNSTVGPNNTVMSSAPDGNTLPLFLQDLGTSATGLFEKMQTFLDEDSDFDGPPAGSHLEEGGRLEFASMFDTLHAQDTHTDTWQDCDLNSVEVERKVSAHFRDLEKVQSKLLTAWAVSMSLGNVVEHRTHLLRHTLFCMVRVAALLHLIPSHTYHIGRKKGNPASTHVLHLLKALLSFLPWDNTELDGPCCLGLVVELCKRLVHLLMNPDPDSYQTGHCQPSCQSLSTTVQILHLVSDSLDHAYSLQHRTVWSSAERESLSQPSDVYHIPLLKGEKKPKDISVQEARPVPQRPSSRLFGVWQWIYKITQQYLEELKRFEGCDGWEEEQQQLVVIMSQIQTALQATGERLEADPVLLSYPGENLFLCGLYPKSVDAWQSQICDENNKYCDRRVFQEQRLCLALLYGLLSQYRLREAQELGDHMSRLLLHRSGNLKDDINITDSLPCSWLPIDLHSEAACAVVQSLGRFMASYFTNQPLNILPPHNVSVLPPLHLPHAPNVERLVPLCQEEVATAVRRHHLSEVWTVEYALDLLLLGGLLPEAVWLAYHLGDWKTAVSISLAYTSYCTDHLEFAGQRRRELHLPGDLEAENIFQAELERLLGNKVDSKEHGDMSDDKSFTDPLEGEDLDLLMVSIQEILKASVMAGVNVVSSPLSSLLDTAKDLCSSLPLLVPSGLYLPSPPLYCPQPSPNTQDPIGSDGYFAEVAARHKVSGVLQKILLLLKSARCCYPAAQWYITNLRRARHLLHKIKKKYSYPGAAQEEKPFPEGLLKFVTRRGFFKWGPNKDGRLDTDAIKTIVCFRELCGLCWMLHVRDQLSFSCRKYQAARDEQISGDSKARFSCVEALHWACRFLPFSHFVNAETILQDILLSLVAELPPISLVAETLVQAFPEEEESVRVSLREKYNALLQRLRQCNVLGEKEEKNELMMLLIQDKRRQRRKHLGRLRRHLAPPELCLWEKEEEEEDRGSKHGMAELRHLSLGTSLSTSTLTDCAFPTVYSDGDTAENTSEAVSPEQHCGIMASDRKGRKVKNSSVNIKSAIREESNPDPEGNKEPSLPVVGTWEFELEDDEYLSFLELFLCYELEKDSADGGDPGSDLPLLKSFSSKLRGRELHSLTFDVLTTVHRRQRDVQLPGKKHWSIDPPVFRAGNCYKPVNPGLTPEPQMSSVWSEAPISKTSVSISSFPGMNTDRPKGLFGLRKQSTVPSTQKSKEIHYGHDLSPSKSAFSIAQPLEGSSTSMEAVVELQQGLDAKLEAEFPTLGRLLEWMVRWADRRVLLGHHGKKMKEKGGGVGGTADDGVVIRVKASAPAVLTALSLLEWRYPAVPRTGSYQAHSPVPEPQWPSVPVLPAEVDRKLERESSIDTGYPGSTNTPITGIDHNEQHEELSGSPGMNEPEKQTYHRVPLHGDQDQMDFHSHHSHCSSQQLSPIDLQDITPEKEGKSHGSRGVVVLPSVLQEVVSENTSTPDASLKLADLDVSENAEDLFTSKSLSLQVPPHPDPQVLPAVQSETSVQAVVTDSIGQVLPKAPLDPPNLLSQGSVAAVSNTFSTAPIHPPSTQPSDMRQQLSEDLCRLVQNINYMSLMEVLGASFSNLQLAQQNSSLALSNMNASHPNVPSSYVTNVLPQPNALPAQPAISVAAPTQTNVPSLPTHCQSQTTRNLASTSRDSAVNPQEMHPLSVIVESPEIQFRQSRMLIPSSQGLLATTDMSHADSNGPVVQPSDSSVQNDTAPLVQGMRLHQNIAPHAYPPAQEPQMLRFENTPSLESHQPNLRPKLQLTSKRTEDDEKRIGSSVLRRQLSFNQPSDSAVRNSQHWIQPSERSSLREVTILPPAFPPHTPAPTPGLRLLRFQPTAHSNVVFPQLPIPLSSRPSAVTAAPVQETPLLKLSYIQSGPATILPRTSSLSPMSRLMSVDELATSVMKGEKAEEVQLLRVDPPNETTRAATMSPSLNSSKRQKRREEKAVREKKTEVTFRPNDSIIPTQESKDEPTNHVTEEPAAAEEITPGPNFAFPLGSFDYLLTDQRFLDNALPTSAELHAFAATRKRFTECQDAFTNTDTACPSSLLDKSVSTSLTFTNPTSKPSHNIQVSSQHVIQDIQVEPERIMDPGCQQLLRVEDLEDTSMHRDLPLYLRPEAQDVPSAHPSSPTFVQPQIHSTHVTASAAADPQQSDNHNHPDITEDSQINSHLESSIDLENVSLQDVSDPFDSQICRAIKSVCVGAPRGSSSRPSVWFSARMSELDAQLVALQKIADYLEQDFTNSRMLVDTIENLAPVMAPDVKSTKAVRKNVRLSVPQEAWMPRSHISKEENNYSKPAFLGEPRTSEERPSFRFSTPNSHRPGLAYLHSPPTKDTKHPLTEVSAIPFAREDENLGHTELSDTAEILDKLVTEGYLSPTELHWSTFQTAHDGSSLVQQQGRSMSQGSVRSEEDRRELRIWMRRKQRERLAVYQKHRDSLREKEHRPFCPSGKVKSPNRNGASILGTRKEKEKFMLLEQHHQRTREAWSLASSISLSPPVRHTVSKPPPQSSTTQDTFSPPLGSTYRINSTSANDKRSPKSHLSQTRPVIHPQVDEVHAEYHSRTPGLHREVTSLPRGHMLTDAESHNKQPAAGSLSKRPSGGARAGTGIHRKQTRIGDVEGVTFLEPILEDDGAGTSVSGMEWLGNLSESTSSTLSKIDWAAIERIVAAVED